jgi:chloride channel 7
MDRGMLTVRPDTPATAVHKLFVAMSLRHVCVVDAKGAAVGIVTRKDLDNAAGAGPWRQAKRAPEPERAWGAGGGGGLRRERSWLSSSVHALMSRLGGSTTSSVAGGGGGGGGDSGHPSAAASLERPRVLGAPAEDGEAQRWAAMNRYESML